MANAARVKVLLVESGRTVGGTERVVWELATRLPEHRWDVGVWLSDAPGVDELAIALEACGIGVARVPEVDSRWDWRGMASTWGRLRRARPTLLHAHHVWPAADRYLSAIARAAGVEHLVVTEHIVGESHSGFQRALKRRELASADAVTAVSTAVAESLMSDYGIGRDRVRVVPNGAEPPNEEAERPTAAKIRTAMGILPFRPLWVCAGRLEEQKGHAVLLEALARLRAQDLDFVVVLAGTGSLGPALERRAAELGLAGHVHFAGQVDPIGPLLRAADAVVLPSLWEGMPLTLLEAMVRGRGVIASEVGGVAEVMLDGVHGRLVPPGDATALAAALAGFHARTDEVRRLGESAAAHAREHYTWDRVIENFEAVYDDVLGLASFSPEDRAASELRAGSPVARGGAR